jgi:hypothetical protein
MVLIHGIRGKTPLPEISAPPHTEIDIAGIAPVCLADCFCQSRFIGWHGDEMDMVGHKAIAPYFYTAVIAPLRHQPDILPVILISEKGLLASVSTLGNVMREAGNNYSG